MLLVPSTAAPCICCRLHSIQSLTHSLIHSRARTPAVGPPAATFTNTTSHPRHKPPANTIANTVNLLRPPPQTPPPIITNLLRHLLLHHCPPSPQATSANPTAATNVQLLQAAPHTRACLLTRLLYGLLRPPHLPIPTALPEITGKLELLAPVAPLPGLTAGHPPLHTTSCC